MFTKSRAVFWYVRAALASGLMLVSLAIFSSALALQASAPEASKAAEATPAASNADDSSDSNTKADGGTDGKTDNTASEAMDGAMSTSQAEAQARAGGSLNKGVLLISSFTVFLLAVFVGVEVINKVPPTLHTPLMSGSNAISGITIVGALLTAGHVGGGFGAVLGMLAIVFAMINVVGGYLVTNRMLLMFKKKK